VKVQSSKFKVRGWHGLYFFLATGSWLLAPVRDAHAMHISEGILPVGWAFAWYVAAAPFAALGLYRLKQRAADDLAFKPLVGLMAAVVFIISCMPVPIPTAGTCSHPAGTGISGILLGPAVSVLVAAAALLIQALFLSHGGLSTLGANILSMGVMGSFAGYAVFRALRSVNVSLSIAAFAAGLLADWATYLTTSAELAAGIRGDSPFLPLFVKVLVAFVPTQLPLGILEGAMTAGMVMLLYSKRPDLLIKMGVVKGQGSEVRGQRYKGVSLILLSIFLLHTSPLTAEAASEKWDGVDKAVVEKIAHEQGREATPPLINTDQGDMLLFLFLAAGAVGGFAAGYYWRVLVAEKAPSSQDKRPS
jgi:cobalt/nickel transport system permease protein